MTVKSSDHRWLLIAGGLSAIGRALATEFARAGNAIGINYRGNPDQAESLAEKLMQDCHSPLARAIQVDVRHRAEVCALFERAYSATDGLSVLVNCARDNIDGPFLEMTDEAWDTVISTILSGSFTCSQEFARRYAGSEGNIINVGAITAIRGRKNGANDCSARAGVVTLRKCMPLELAPNIRVNTVTPGRIDTLEIRGRYKDKENDNRVDFE